MTRVFRALAGAGVVPADVADARAESRRILERAQGELEARLTAAVEEGRALGRAELAAELLALGAERERRLAELEPTVIEVALLAAKRILGEAVALEPERIVGIVKPLLARVRRARTIELRVHPLDRATLAPRLDALRGGLESLESLELVADPSVSRGGCLLHSNLGSLDARIETQLDALGQALAKRT